MNKSSPFIHAIEPRDPIEVDSPHGRGIVLYITVYGVHGNDMWCVAQQGGRARSGITRPRQLQLAFNGAARPEPAHWCVRETLCHVAIALTRIDFPGVRYVWRDST